jgi:hypothetical protein
MSAKGRRSSRDLCEHGRRREWGDWTGPLVLSLCPQWQLLLLGRGRCIRSRRIVGHLAVCASVLCLCGVLCVCEL